MARGRHKRKPKDTTKRLRINDQVRISPVRLIGANNEQIGVVETSEAKKKARDAELDLVEVAPQADPPVCRVMDYGKWRYAQRKKEQKAKAHAKQSELKGMRLRPKIDDHDLSIKVNKARDFLEDGDKVQFTMLFKGREMAHRDLGREQMEQVLEKVKDIAKVEAPPKMMGRRMAMTVAPTVSKKKGEGEDDGASEAEQPSADNGEAGQKNNS